MAQLDGFAHDLHVYLTTGARGAVAQSALGGQLARAA